MVHSARWTMDENVSQALIEVLYRNDDTDVISQIERVTRAREILPHPDELAARRDIEYLDIALEAYVR